MFSKMCREGLTFSCVVCNQCLYKRSVKEFDPDKNLFEFEAIDDTDMFICLFF